MKPTAVQWFFEWMGNNQYFIGNDLLEAFKQAKEMEKQQIIKANEENMMSFTDGEQYYNETFNKGQ